ncbi:hypothetical protein, partial [Pseudomonas aeruginosa]
AKARESSTKSPHPTTSKHNIPWSTHYSTPQRHPKLTPGDGTPCQKKQCQQKIIYHIRDRKTTKLFNT